MTNIASLKFSQSTRTMDPNERSRVRTVTTTTSFSMNKDAAKGIREYSCHLIRLWGGGVEAESISQLFDSQCSKCSTQSSLCVVTSERLSSTWLASALTIVPLCVSTGLIQENAADMAATVFKDRCIWVLTPKGLDVSVFASLNRH